MPRVFAEPGRLWLLVLLAILALVVSRGSSRRQAEWKALGLFGAPLRNGVWLWWLAEFCSILALAAPRWGRQPGSELPPGHDLVFLIDVSRSMGAEDAVPDRLRLAKGSARSLISQLRSDPGDRAALVAFAGRAVIRCPLTASLDSVVDRVDDLQPGSVEPGGTDLGAGLAVAFNLFDTTEHADGRSIILFSDGEDHAGTWSRMIEPLVDAQIPVHVVAIGDPEKSVPVPALIGMPGVATASTSSPLTRRNDVALTQLAYATGGAVVPLGLVPTDLGTLYRDTIRPTTRSQRPVLRFSERAERFSVCLSAALAAGIWGSWPRSRRHLFRSNLNDPGRAYPWGRLMVVSLIVLILLFISLAANPVSPDAAAEAATNRGTTAYRAGHFAEALAEFEAATTFRPENPVGPFDEGATLFAAGRYPEAIARYEVARQLAIRGGRRNLIAKIDYGLGNCLAMMGDFAGAVVHYEECLTATDIGSLRQDATLNRDFALKQITSPTDEPERTGSGENPSDQSNSSPENRSDPDQQHSSKHDDPANNNQTAGGPQSSSTSKRGTGGAGGDGAALPESDSTENRLEAALRRIRAAKEKRPEKLSQASRPPVGKNSEKDW